MGRMEVLVYVFGSTSVSEMCVLRFFACFLTKRSSSCLKKKTSCCFISCVSLEKRKEHIKGTDINVQSDEQHLLECRRCYL